MAVFRYGRHALRPQKFDMGRAHAFTSRVAATSTLRAMGRAMLGGYYKKCSKRNAHRLRRQGTSGASAPAGNQPAEAKDRRVCNACGRAGIRLLKGALPVMPLRIANIVMAAAL